MSRGLLAALGALLCISRPDIGLGQGDATTGPVMDIAPLEADIEAMRRTLRSLEALVDERASERLAALISPRVSEPQRRGITQAVEAQLRSMPAGAGFTMRTDIGRGAVVPVGPARVQVQVSSTLRQGESRRTGRVDLELEAVERDGRRQWLLVEVVFPGQRPILTGGFPTATFVALLSAMALAAGALVWRLRRRRSRSRP